MAKQLVLSLISIFILSMYQINQSLTVSLLHSGHATILNDRLAPVDEYAHQVIIQLYL
jgi:hypothetical protein